MMSRCRTLLASSALILSTFSAHSIADTPEYTGNDLNQQLVMATMWMQVSGEYRALAHQAFNLAHLQFDKVKSTYQGDKKLAVVVDVDETVLDNSAYEAWLLGQDKGYSSETWNQWMAASQAIAIPGAVDFLNYVVQQGGDVFYITNRKEVGYEGTERNLKAAGFPQVDKAHLMLRTDTSNKEPRRQVVEKDHHIALLMGDNLNDFSKDFHVNSLEESYQAVENDKAKFGAEFIVLPNPTYGDWEGKVYKGNWGASPADKDAMRKEALRYWDTETK